MRMMLPPLRPIGSNLGLPTEVQDLLALLPDLLVALLQSCLSLECTVAPKSYLRLIAERFRGSTTPLGGGVGGCRGPVPVPGPGGMAMGLPVAYAG